MTAAPGAVRPFIEKAPWDVRSWVEQFQADELPVLRSSALALEELRENEDDVDAHLLAESFAHDPLLTIKVHAHLAHVRRGREGTDTETLTAALVMLGISPFFRAFGPQPTVEDHLASHPEALEAIRLVLRRSSRAARFALAFAVHRIDHDTAVIHEAALLHDFAELLMWLRAPDLACEVARRQRADPTLRSATVQADVYHIRLPELQHALMTRWRLPRLLIDITDNKREAVSVQARNVVLAIRLARHSSCGWDNAALADDVRDIAALLNMAPEPTLALLRDIDEP